MNKFRTIHTLSLAWAGFIFFLFIAFTDASLTDLFFSLKGATWTYLITHVLIRIVWYIRDLAVKNNPRRPQSFNTQSNTTKKTESVTPSATTKKATPQQPKKKATKQPEFDFSKMQQQNWGLYGAIALFGFVIFGVFTSFFFSIVGGAFEEVMDNSDDEYIFMDTLTVGEVREYTVDGDILEIKLVKADGDAAEFLVNGEVHYAVAFHTIELPNFIEMVVRDVHNEQQKVQFTLEPIFSE